MHRTLCVDILLASVFEHKMSLSIAEINYIAQGVSSNCRIDGRQVFDYSDIDVEMGILPRANGSAKCKLGTATCIVQIIGNVVDSEVEDIVFTIDKRSDVTEDQMSDLEIVFSNVTVKLPRFHDKFKWQISVVISFTNATGNIVDTCFVALKSAIWDLKLPHLNVLNGEVEVVDDINSFEKIIDF